MAATTQKTRVPGASQQIQTYREGSIYFGGCPRDRGTVQLERDAYGHYGQCLNCGWMKDLPDPTPPNYNPNGNGLH